MSKHFFEIQIPQLYGVEKNQEKRYTFFSPLEIQKLEFQNIPNMLLTTHFIL